MPGDFGPGDLFQAHYNDMYAPGFDYEVTHALARMPECACTTASEDLRLA